MASTSEELICLQGYSREDFISLETDVFKCGICLNVLKNAHQCLRGHCFCFGCWQLHFFTNEFCPICKVIVDRNSLSHNLLADQVIQKLDIKCYGRDSNDEHCKWIGKLENREKHILECEFLKEVECPFYHNGLCISQCNGKINRSSILSHIETCTDSIVIDADKLQRLLTSITGGFYRFRCYRQFKYVGDIKNGLKHGQGLLKSMDGKSHYDGEWLNDKRHGFGMQSFSEWSYRGDWFEDTMHGNCVCATCPAGTYMGHYQNNQPNGHGVFVSVTDSVHSVYTGEWLNGERCGKGSLVWHQNHHYHGDFQNDQFNGQGKLSVMGNVWEGLFADGKANGVGSFASTDGDYNGMFKNDRFDGEGEWKHVNGSHFVGTFHNQYYKQGQLQSANGDVYVGHFKSGLYHGQGKLTKMDGSEYTGMFAAGEYHGHGSLTLQDTLVYTGEFNYGLKHGQGKQGMVGKRQYLVAFEDDIQIVE